MKELATGLSLGIEAAQWGNASFAAEVYEKNLPYIRSRVWATEEKSYNPNGNTVRLVEQYDVWDAVWWEKEALCRAWFGNGSVTVSAASKSDEAVVAALKHMRDLFPLRVIGEKMEIPITFWTYSPHGPRAHIRNIMVPSWQEIQSNYASTLTPQMRGIMNEFRPAFGGQLLLWLGPPGTGKTWALRALGWEWRRWCSLSYIVDPDVLFGRQADYLTDVLLAHADPSMEGEEPEEKWRVLILEDTGELLSADAKEKTGQSLGRLLNVVDGLLGQGLRVLVLVTTNDELPKLHPAIQRPGRCAAKVEFLPLPAREADAWRDNHGLNGDRRIGGQATLAELYAELEGYYDDTPTHNVGFAMSQ